MLADLTFTVELTPLQVRAIKLAQTGFTDKEIVARSGGSTEGRRKELRQVLADLRLDVMLLDATRDEQITWRFKEEATPASSVKLASVG